MKNPSQTKLPVMAIPTNHFASDVSNRHHLPKIKEGRISFEVFTKSRARRLELGLPIYEYTDDV